jgi:hypothetical protein
MQCPNDIVDKDPVLAPPDKNDGILELVRCRRKEVLVLVRGRIQDPTSLDRVVPTSSSAEILCERNGGLAYRPKVLLPLIEDG